MMANNPCGNNTETVQLNLYEILLRKVFGNLDKANSLKVDLGH